MSQQISDIAIAHSSFLLLNKQALVLQQFYIYLNQLVFLLREMLFLRIYLGGVIAGQPVKYLEIYIVLHHL